MNGHKDKDGKYHYHATKKYPYLNGGFYGVVSEKDGQVDPQPQQGASAHPLCPRSATRRSSILPKRGPRSYKLTYDVKGRKGTVSYTLNADGEHKFTFVDVDGKTRTETYREKNRGPEGGQPLAQKIGRRH